MILLLFFNEQKILLNLIDTQFFFFFFSLLKSSTLIFGEKVFTDFFARVASRRVASRTEEGIAGEKGAAPRGVQGEVCPHPR